MHGFRSKENAQILSVDSKRTITPLLKICAVCATMCYNSDGYVSVKTAAAAKELKKNGSIVPNAAGNQKKGRNDKCDITGTLLKLVLHV